MLNRHNIRKKLVFAVYQEYISNPKILHKSNIIQNFRIYCQESNHILANILDLLLEICNYAHQDLMHKQQIKQPKSLQSHLGIERLRSQVSTLATPKILQNKALLYLANQLHNYKAKYPNQLGKLFDEDIIKRLFYTLAKSPEYRDYLALDNPSVMGEAKIIKFILGQIIMQEEVLEDILEANFLMAYEDAQIACLYILKALNNYASSPQNIQDLLVDIEQYEELAQVITEFLVREYHNCQQMIFPKIQHWEEHRICSLDKVLLLLGLCEILHYSKVPVRVVINEYIEIAKEYSTEKSKNFINGILDALLKDLISAGRISQVRL